MAGQIEVKSTGIVVPQTSEIKEAFQGVFTAALGTDLSLDDATPQGNIIDGLTQQKELDNAQLLLFLNQLNPDTASGRYQDAIASLYFLKRHEATSSIVNCECTGVPGTVLLGVSSGTPAMAQSTSGDVFECLIGGTIPASGTITLQFGSVETGNIPVGANTINKIYNVVNGWDTVNNSVAGVTGVDVESREDFANRIKKSLAVNATGSLAAIQSRLYQLDGVTHVKVEENDGDTSVTKAGISLDPHSVYICVSGASDTEALAKAIFDSKSAGCGTTHTTAGYQTLTYTDPTTGAVQTYYYYIPTNTNVYVRISTSASLPSAAQNKIKQILYDNFNGQNNDGYAGVGIGETVYASRFYNAVLNAGIENLSLNAITVSLNGSTWKTNVTFDMNLLPVLDISGSTYVKFVVE